MRAVDNDPRPDIETAKRVKAEYLAMRRWSPSTWDRHGLEVVFRNHRLAIRHPFRFEGETWSWQDRMWSGDIKWMTAKSAPQMPFNIDTLDDQSRDYVHVVEGPADAITLTEALFADYPVIAAPGAATWRPRWGKALAGRIVIVSGDNDEAGARFVGKVIESVKPHAAFIGAVMPPHEHNDLSDWWKKLGGEAAEAITVQLAAIDSASGRRAGPPRIRGNRETTW